MGRSATAATVFACRIGANTVSVTEDAGRLTYRYGTPNRVQLSIAAPVASSRVLYLIQRMAGAESQLRLKSGDYTYIVYSAEGDSRSGARAVSGLVVMKRMKRIGDKACSRYAALSLPADKDLPEDSDAFSAM